MHSLEDRALRPQIRARNQSQSADKRAAQVAQNVSVQVLRQQYVVLVRIHHQLHAGVVYDVLVVLHLRKALANLAAAAQKQPVRELHDVRLVDRMDLLSSMFAGIVEGKLGNPRRTLLGNNLQRLHHARNDDVLEPRIQVFHVFAHDNDVQPRIAGLQPGKILDRTKVRKALELLTQGDIDRRET